MVDLFKLETKKIKDVENKQPINLYAKIESFGLLKASNQTEYFNLDLRDDTGVINAKKWDVKEEEKQGFGQGDLVFIEGTGSEYNGKVQLIIRSMRLVNEFDAIDESIFYERAPMSLGTLKEEIEGYITRIKNMHLHVITRTLIDKHYDAYFEFPAATKNHHAYISGLAYHVLTMLKLADGFLHVYPALNRDLLYAGILLHDLGKVIELSDHLSPRYTKVGQLIGHINLCFEAIRLVADAKSFASEEVLLLQHLILSHHGQMEYGSPKEPMVLEAEVLHLIDLADSRITMITSDLEETDEESFSKRNYALGRSFYKHRLNKKVPIED